MEQKKLFNKDFTLVIVGQIISLFGNAILRFALPLYLLRETGSAALFGIVSACSFLPMIILSLLGGVLADRVNKRNIMVGLDFSTAVLITLFYLVLGRVPIIPLFIVVLMLLYGISGTYQPTVQASIPLLVSGEHLMPANAAINQIASLAGLLGPVIGGMLYGAFGINPILLISILCFLSSAVMELFIKIPHNKREDNRGMTAIVKGDLKEGIHFIVKERPVFLRVAVLLSVFNLIISALIIIGIPILIVDILGMSDVELGITQGALALGGLAGGILTGVIGGKLKLSKAHFLLMISTICVAIMSITLVLETSAMISYINISVMSFFAMAVSTMFTIQMMVVVQAEAPPHLLGKVMATLMAFVMCANPIGQAVYGILFGWLHDRSWIILLVAAVIAGVISVLSRKIFREFETVK